MQILIDLAAWSYQSRRVGFEQLDDSIGCIFVRVILCRRYRLLGFCWQRLPELNLVSIRVIDPGKATVGFIHSFVVDLYSLLF